uniref:Uncharacterized protein n=1 Tax=Picea glauca TaxID=3330 RepID=A0A101LTZ5_PICGL|nr:hypothetical protein ABT39_MTgene3484 [Picea glauca]
MSSLFPQTTIPCFLRFPFLGGFHRGSSRMVSFVVNTCLNFRIFHRL